MPTATLSPDPASLHVEELISEEDSITVVVSASRVTARCPDCDQPTARVHSHYWRTPVDLPWQGLTVRLRLRTRRWRCANPRCPRRIFTERLPDVVAPSARRTARLAAVVEAVAFALGGEPGARILRRLGVPLSGDALLAAIRRAAEEAPATPAILGVDDFALRRGRRYGTLLVDLEARRPVDILPDATSASLAAWLADHPGIRIICRDRAGAYAEGARQGAPDAIQIADRFHLLVNLGDALEETVLAAEIALPALPRDEPPAPTPTVPPEEPPAAPPPNQAERVRRGRQRRREQRHADIHTLLAEGLSLRAIARRTGLNRRTVKRYARAAHCPGYAPRPRRPGLIAPYLDHLRRRWAAGEHNARVLYDEVRAQGFAGRYERVAAAVAPWREAPEPRQRRTPARRPGPEPASTRRLSPRRLAWWLRAPDDALTAAQQQALAAVLDACPALGAARALAREFVRLIHNRDEAALTPWLLAAEQRDLAAFRSLAAGIRRDEAAVRAALRYAWSSGQVEGQVTRVKLLKRMMFGRAKPDLLRRRILRAA
jgi:transposase